MHMGVILELKIRKGSDYDERTSAQEGIFR